MSYERSQNNRQRILDHLHANPHQSAKTISMQTGLGHNPVKSCCRFMLQMKEIQKHSAGKMTKYTAIATTTISAEEVARTFSVKQAKKIAPVDQGKIERPGHYIQRGGNWQAAASEDAQNSRMPRVFAGSTCGML